MTIDDAVKSAFENNIDIKLSDNSLKLLKKQKDFSWNSISPTLNASGNFSQNFEGDVNSLSISGGVNLAISSNLYTSIRNANLNYETGKITAEQKRKLIELNVRTAFYGLLYEKENISLQKRGLETSENQYKQNQEKFKKGQMSELDVLTSRVNYEQKKPSVEAAIVTYQN
ncbi:MAG: TolC family protein, partial [Treponema sp.]|nr:TolC family protein [Treponema sp.]